MTNIELFKEFVIDEMIDMGYSTQAAWTMIKNYDWNDFIYSTPVEMAMLIVNDYKEKQ